MAPGCTDPNSNTTFAADEGGGAIGPLPDSFRYPSRKGFDEFFGYGRIDAYKSAQEAALGQIPPEVDITSPEWFQQLDPGGASVAVEGYVDARSAYTCTVEVAPGAQPNNAPSSAGGDFVAVPSTYCGGTTHKGPFHGLLASLSTATLESLFPHADPSSFGGNENGGPGLTQTANGRPNTLPYAFTVRVVVSTAAGSSRAAMTGEDRRQMFLHRDQDMLKGLPLEMRGDGDASPLLVDLAGNDTNQLIVANSDGWIHAYQYSPTTGKLKDLPGWPVHTESLPLHTGETAFSSGQVSTGHYAAVLEAPAAGDLFGDGRTEIVADDNQGNVYAWDGGGHLLFHQKSNPSYSGAPLTGDPSWAAQRAGVRDRTEGGFLTSPVLAKLDPAAGRGLDVVAAGEDRHVYAWHADGSAVGGFPVLVEDPNKVASVDATSNQPQFNANAKADPGKDEDQGKIVDTPAVAYLDGPNNPPSIVVGTNEEYLTGTGDEGSLNSSKTNTASLGVLGSLLKFANGRVYAIKAGGYSSEPGSAARSGFTCSGAQCTSAAIRPGWPAKIGLINAGLLPDVGEGINGSPVVAPLSCPEGGQGPKVGVTPDAGPGYILNPDGSSCYGSSEGSYNALQTDFAAGNGKTDTPTFPAVGEPSFGTLDGGLTTDFFAPTAGLLRALDVVAPNYQKGSQDFTAAWDGSTGQFRPGFPAVNNDLSFITGQVIGDVTGEAPAQEVLAGTASNDLQAYNAAGAPAGSAWPKLTGDWLVATPVLGSLGTVDTESGASKDVVSLTRSGTLSVYSTPAAACSPSSWPNFHHDIANSGDYTRDAIAPGKPLRTTMRKKVLRWIAPGDDGMCGSAASYEIVTSASPITPQSFAQATSLSGAPAPAPAGSEQSFPLPAGTLRYVAIRATDLVRGEARSAPGAHTRGLPDASRCDRAAARSHAGSRGEPAGLHGRAQCLVVTLVLLGVSAREGEDRAVEAGTAAEIGADRDAVAAAGVCPRERPAAQAAVGFQVGGLHPIDLGRALPVAQLAPVEVSGAVLGPGVHVNPAEKDVAARLDQALSLDDPLAVIGELAPAEELLQHRRFCLLELQHERILAVATHQQRDPGAGSDAADADDLAREIDQLELLEQRPPVARKRLRVGAEKLVQLREHEIAAARRGEFADRHDQRRVGHDPRLPFALLRQLRERGEVVVGVRLRDLASRALPGARAQLRAKAFECRFGFELGVPDLQISHRCEFRHRGAIGRDCREHRAFGRLGAEAVVLRRDHHAAGEALHIPLPRPAERLVEVVDVEHQLPLDGGEQPEVREMGVAAALHREPTARRRGEIARHHRGGAAEEGERGDQHPAVADRDELGDPRALLPFQQRHRVGALG